MKQVSLFLALLVIPVMVSARSGDSTSTARIFSPEAKEHYAKVGALSALAGAGLGGIFKDYLGKSSGNNPVSRAAIGGFFFGSIVRLLNYKNPKGLEDSSYPVAVVLGSLAWGAGEAAVGYYVRR